MVHLALPARCALASLLLALNLAAGAQAPASSPLPSRSTPPPGPARHEPEASGPFAGVMWGHLDPKGPSDTRFVIFSAFRGLNGCTRDEFSAVRVSNDNVREEGCLLLSVSDRRVLQVRWADGRVLRYAEADWTLKTGLR